MALNKIVSIVLVLEGNEGFAGKMGKIEGISIVLSELHTQIHVFVIQELNLIGNVSQRPYLCCTDPIFLIRCSLSFIFAQIFLNELVSIFSQIFHFSEIITESYTRNNRFFLNLSFLVLSVYKPNKIVLNFISNFFFIQII